MLVGNVVIWRASASNRLRFVRDSWCKKFLAYNEEAAGIIRKFENLDRQWKLENEKYSQVRQDRCDFVQDSGNNSLQGRYSP